MVFSFNLRDSAWVFWFVAYVLAELSGACDIESKIPLVPKHPPAVHGSFHFNVIISVVSTLQVVSCHD